ncbi:hypothetical protein AAHA92_02468 [Salvia divinorum]|uniref:Secreted protein n=1 Tax=Salvia divinorum TaxID=28513 RepID=A0ABD1IDY9_SALDI
MQMKPSKWRHQSTASVLLLHSSLQTFAWSGFWRVFVWFVGDTPLTSCQLSPVCLVQNPLWRLWASPPSELKTEIVP